MFKTYLFDLDETLLPYAVSMEDFARAAARAMATYFSRWVPPDQFIRALIDAYQAMDAYTGGTETNAELCMRIITSQTRLPADQFRDAFEEFCRTEAGELRHLVRPSPDARRIMDWLFRNGMQVAIATGMQAPLVFGEARLSWAGIPVTDYPYSFIATWDNMHASKPYPAFYRELLGHVGADAGQCLFVGDSWDLEMVPATNLGIHAFWVAPAGTTRPAELDLLCGQGPLSDLCDWITAPQKRIS